MVEKTSPNYRQYQELELYEAPKWWKIITKFHGVDLSKITIMVLAILAKEWTIYLIAIICICLLELKSYFAMRGNHATSSTKVDQSSDELGDARGD